MAATSTSPFRPLLLSSQTNSHASFQKRPIIIPPGPLLPSPPSFEFISSHAPVNRVNGASLESLNSTQDAYCTQGVWSNVAASKPVLPISISAQHHLCRAHDPSTSIPSESETSMDNQIWDAEIMLKRYIYDYMQRKNLHAAAETFREEAGVPQELLEIDAYSNGFLLDWWLIFWDMFTGREHRNQQSSTEIMERGVVIGEGKNIVDQVLQPSMNSRNASFNTANNIIQNNFIMNNQQIHCMPYIQGLETKSNSQHVAMQNTRVMTSGHPIGNDSESLYDANQLKLNNARYDLPANSVNSDAEKNNLPRVGSSAGSGKILWFLNEEEKLKLQIPNQRQSNSVPLVTMGNNIETQTSDRSYQFSRFVNPSGESSTEPSLRKRKEPYPCFSLSNKEDESRAKIPLSNLTSILNPASQLLNSSSHVAQYGTSKQLELSHHDKEAPEKENGLILHTEVANDEGHKVKHSGNALEDNSNNGNDQNKQNDSIILVDLTRHTKKGEYGEGGHQYADDDGNHEDASFGNEHDVLHDKRYNEMMR